MIKVLLLWYAIVVIGDDILKLNVNYDLLEHIERANRCLSLKREAKNMVLYSSITATVQFIGGEPLEVMPFRLGYNALFYIAMRSPLLFLFHKLPIYEEERQFRFDRIIKDLAKIEVSTNRDLLLEAHAYKREYEIGFYKSVIPYLKENKYIMVPSYNGYSEGETSVLQEHVVGTRAYELSVGEPKKEYKLSYRRAYGGA